MKLPTSYLMTYLTANAEQFAASYLRIYLAHASRASLCTSPSTKPITIHTCPSFPQGIPHLNTLPISQPHKQPFPLPQIPPSPTAPAPGPTDNAPEVPANRLCFPRQQPLSSSSPMSQMPNVNSIHQFRESHPSKKEKEKETANKQPQWNHPPSGAFPSPSQPRGE